MFENKPYCYPEGNESNNSTDKHKVQVPNQNSYQGKKNQTKNQGPELEDDTNIKGWCTDLGGYILDLGMRALDKFSRTTEELDHYLGEIYRDNCHPFIITNTSKTFPDPDMPTIIPAMVNERPKTNREVNYLENNTIDEAIRQKPRKEGVYKTDMHNI